MTETATSNPEPAYQVRDGRLHPRPAWLDLPQVKAVVAAMGPGNLRFVGGAVRDLFLGRKTVDIDAATPLPPEETVARLEAAGIRAVPTGFGHGTVTAAVDGRTVEITTLRHDVETDGRHARVAFTDDWAADAARRDFTVNALYLAPDGTLHDPEGGLADVQARRLRFIGNPADRIAEDRLRILRYFRFMAVLGAASSADQASLAAIRAGLSGLASLSVERRRDEFMKLLKEKPAPAVIALMHENGVLAALCEGLATGPIWQTLAANEEESGLVAPPLVRLVALLGMEKLRVGRFVAGYRFSKADTRLAVLMTDAYHLPDREKVVKWQEASCRFGKEAAEATIWLADPKGQEICQILEACHQWEVPAFPVKSSTLIENGIPQGPELGRRLKLIKDDWIANGFVLGDQAQ